MARQKSEDPIVPKALGNLGPTETTRGGKGIPVNEEMEQLGLPLVTAEGPKGATRPAGGGQPPPRTSMAPKATGKTVNTPYATLRSVIEHLDEALDHVVRNRGAPGLDGQTVGQVHKDWPRIVEPLADALRTGRYQPGPLRQVRIPKPGGGQRELGIPNVVDRVVQEAIRLCLQPLFDPGFHPSSHGFRPKRSCHTALAEAQKHIEAGYDQVVDLDLSKFFDRVNHQRLMARLARTVQDRPLLVLLGNLLKSTVVLPEGVRIQTEQGVPQGGPLSPLLSNIVLDELDWELERRGHRFVRYADDIAIFVRSERSGRRVMESVTRFIEGRLRLKLNAEKSCIRRPEEGNFLGFRLTRGSDGRTEIRLSSRTMDRAIHRIRELTPRNWGGSLKSCAERVDRYFTGWFGFFGVCSERARYELQVLDGRARRRLRAIKLKQWKRKRTILRHLTTMKYTPKVARNVYRGRRNWWSLSHDGVVSHRLSKQWLAEQGLRSLVDRLEERVLFRAAPAQQSFEWG